MHRSSAILLLIVAAAGCTPTCERTCTRLDSCSTGLQTATNIDCVETCVTLQQLHEETNDDDSREAFAAHRRCLVSSTCEEIDEGVCYDETLYLSLIHI